MNEYTKTLQLIIHGTALWRLLLRHFSDPRCLICRALLRKPFDRPL